MEDVESELNKTKAELEKSVGEHMKLKEDTASKEHNLQDKISKQEEQVSVMRLETDRLKNQVRSHFVEELNMY